MEKKDFVVVKIKNSQEKVHEGLELEVDKIEGEPKDKLEFAEVLLSSKGGKIEIGKPFIKGAKVTAEIVAQTKADKVTTRKFKSKARYRKTTGNRKPLTKIVIKSI
jgi:large subunit ribosomal protein L21